MASQTPYNESFHEYTHLAPPPRTFNPSLSPSQSQSRLLSKWSQPQLGSTKKASKHVPILIGNGYDRNLPLPTFKVPSSIHPNRLSIPVNHKLPPTPPITPTFPAEEFSYLPFSSTSKNISSVSPKTSSKTTEPSERESVASKYLTTHSLDKYFEKKYTLGHELGSGGFGFVIAAKRNSDGREVAVKFIIKRKVPVGGLVDATAFAPVGSPKPRLVPLEVYILGQVRHPNIIKLYDLFEDDTFYYVVMELFGSSWSRKSSSKKKSQQHEHAQLQTSKSTSSIPSFAAAAIAAATATCQAVFDVGKLKASSSSIPSKMPSSSSLTTGDARMSSSKLTRRPSCDLFECIEVHNRMDEGTARAIMRQVIDAIAYLDTLGICHRDIKDENIVVDENFKVKLIDFGSAVIMPHSPLHPNNIAMSTTSRGLRRPRSEMALRDISNTFYLTRFHGTLNFASPEILRNTAYRPQPADVWSIGVLLYTLLTGETPFRQPMDALTKQPRSYDKLMGRIPSTREPVSPECKYILESCFIKDPNRRITIHELANSTWLH